MSAKTIIYLQIIFPASKACPPNLSPITSVPEIQPFPLLRCKETLGSGTDFLKATGLGSCWPEPAERPLSSGPRDLLLHPGITSEQKTTGKSDPRHRKLLKGRWEQTVGQGTEGLRSADFKSSEPRKCDIKLGGYGSAPPCSSCVCVCVCV